MKRRTVLLRTAVVACLALAGGTLWLPHAQAASVTATITKDSIWDDGFTADGAITNGTGSAMTGWKVEFDLPSGTGVGSYWNALMTRSGNHYTFTNREYNATIKPGKTVTFGFVGTGTGDPRNCRINGASCSGGTPPTTPPPTGTPSPTTSPPTSPTPSPTVSPTASPTPGPGGTPVAINGQLRVCGVKLCNQYGKPIQLRGMSTHGLQWYPQCVNNASMDALAKDWNADVIRLSMYIQEGGYETNPRKFTDLMHSLIEEATARGMYAIVDWHQLSPGDPNYNLDRAKTFFTEIAQRHKDKTNILYDVANEPNGVSWATVRNYHQQIIPVVRAQDADSVILLGTHGWGSLGVSDGRNETDVINSPVSFGNVLYTFHFYAASHDDEYLNTLSRAADRIPMFVTEFGTQTYTGDGGNDFTMSQRYLDLMASKKISWVNWNFSDDSRSGAVFTGGTCPNGPFTGTSRLKPAGVWIRDRIRTPDDFPTS
jgi:endoglucanase